jgi:hypothetical protein
MTLGSVLNDSGLNRYMPPPETAEHVLILDDTLQARNLTPSTFLCLSIP